MSSKNKKGDEEGQASTKAASQLEPPLPTPNKKSRPVRKVKSDPGPDMDDVAEDVGLSFDFLDEETGKGYRLFEIVKIMRYFMPLKLFTFTHLNRKAFGGYRG